MRRPVIVRYEVKAARWSAGRLRIAVLSDLHVVAPWTPLSAVAKAVARIMAEAPDLILLPGDFLADPKLLGWRPDLPAYLAVLERLSAPLGVFASLGNHDWADCALARQTNGARNSVVEAFAESPITLLQNASVAAGPVWIAGVDSMVGAGSGWRPERRDDLGQALSGIPTGADTILMAHEPDFWVEALPDVALTVAGHTHGGQITWGDWRPLTPSRYGGRYAHGLHSDGDRHLVVSGGFGYTGVPIRVGVPPEITWIELSGA